MVKFTPAQIPDWVYLDERRSAEIKVFKKLAEVLNDDWHIFYSRPWWGLNQRGGEKDGEADFILAHPNLGLLFLEVKGGQIQFDAITDKWASVDRYGIRHEFPKSPVFQAMTCKHELLKKFKTFKTWPTEKVIAHHGVVFVDTVASDVPYVGGYEQEIFCFSIEFERSFAEWIEARLTTHVGAKEIGPGSVGINVVYEVLAKPLELRTTLSRISDLAVEQMNNLLTGTQLQIIAEIESETRFVIEGGAGTGKTVVACELAARSIDKGKNVALSCVGETLLVDFQRRFEGKSELLDVLSVEKLISNQKKYDLIIVDESQDVDWVFWDRIENLLKNESSKLVCFTDSNQAIYRLATDLSTRLQAKRRSLLVNLRNTQKIATVINRLYKGPSLIVSGPDGVEPLSIIVNDMEQAVEKICLEVKRLHDYEGVDFSSIVILSEDKDFLRKLQPYLKALYIFVANAKNRALNTLTVDTIWNFKGLESPFVFVYADNETGNNREYAYVATSRARTNLVVYSKSDKTLINQVLFV